MKKDTKNKKWVPELEDGACYDVYVFRLIDDEIVRFRGVYCPAHARAYYVSGKNWCQRCIYPNEFDKVLNKGLVTTRPRLADAYNKFRIHYNALHEKAQRWYYYTGDVTRTLDALLPIDMVDGTWRREGD